MPCWRKSSKGRSFPPFSQVFERLYPLKPAQSLSKHAKDMILQELMHRSANTKPLHGRYTPGDFGPQGAG
jgi:hypothetical protein